MMLMECRNIKKSFGELNILKDVSFDIAYGSHIGLVGVNGAGKTTLVEILTGNLEPDSGNIYKSRENFSIGYMKQEAEVMLSEKNNTENNFLHTSSSFGLKKVQNWEHERKSNLSGGEKTKLALSHIWSEKPDLIILDEPTNHMDFEGINYLMDSINNYNGTVIIISHDRYFLDRTAHKIIELRDGLAEEYNGNYSFYHEERKKRYESALNQYLIQKGHEEKLESSIKGLKTWSSKAHDESRKKANENGGTKEYYRNKAKKMDNQVKSIIKKLEKLKTEGIEKPKEDPSVYFDFKSGEKHGSRILEAKDIAKSYGDRMLFESSSFTVQYGERIGIIGPNGCGKTTLIRMILGKEELSEGSIWLSPSLNVGYLSQDVLDLNPELTILESVCKSTKFHKDTEINLLLNMGFDIEALSKKSKVLSLGERVKIKLASLILKGTNLLILDEPGNHLDIMSREQLEETLLSYCGTILLVSHDKYMLQKLTNKLLVFDNKKISKFISSYEDYFNSKSKPSAKATKNDLLLIENRLSFIIGELSTIAKDDPKYPSLDMEYTELINKRNILKSLT